MGLGLLHYYNCDERGSHDLANYNTVNSSDTKIG